MNGFPSNEAITAPAGSRLHALGKFMPGADRPVRDYGSLDPVLGRIGSLEVRLASTAKEIRRAQRLRFKVFYDEMSASPHGVPGWIIAPTSTTRMNSGVTYLITCL